VVDLAFHLAGARWQCGLGGRRRLLVLLGVLAAVSS